MLRGRRIIIAMLLLTGSFFLADQLSKSWARSLEGLERSGTFAVYTVYNPEGTLGLFPAPPALFVIGAAIFFVGFLLLRNRERINLFALFALSLFLAGMLGNSYDRLAHGQVTDWIYADPGIVFNLADIFIFLGLFLVTFFLLPRTKTKPLLN